MANEASGPGAATGSTTPGISPAAAVACWARPSSIRRPRPPPTTASAPRTPARTRNERRAVDVPAPAASAPPADRAEPISESRTRIARPAWTAAETRTSIVVLPARRRDASRPTPTIPRITAIAAPCHRRASRPTPAPTRITTATTNTVRAVLSLVPNRETIRSFEPGGAKSMIAEPTAAIGEGTPAIRPANSSPTASATSAATDPASAARPRGATGTDGEAATGSTGAVPGTGMGWLMGAVSVPRVTLP